jgi:hypothetical protein
MSLTEPDLKVSLIRLFIILITDNVYSLNSPLYPISDLFTSILIPFSYF